MSCFTQRFTGVGVSVERRAEKHGAWKAPGSHVSVSVAANRSVWLLCWVGGGWWDRGPVLGPVGGNGGLADQGGRSTRVLLSRTHAGVRTQKQSLQSWCFFSSAKPLLPFLVTQVEHWGEVLTSRGCAGPEQGSFLQPGGSWVQSHEHAGG